MSTSVDNGKVQMRLPVGIFAEALLCEAYIKGNSKEDQRKLLPIAMRYSDHVTPIVMTSNRVLDLFQLNGDDK